MFNKKQQNIISLKFSGIVIIKGEDLTGKTTTAINRIIYIKDNYCLYEKDNVLVVVYDEKVKEMVKCQYDTYLEKKNQTSLFAYIGSNVDIITLDEFKAKFLKNLDKKKVDIEEKESLLNDCMLNLKKTNKKSKILKSQYIEFILNEFKYIKSKNIKSISEYQTLTRRGRKVDLVGPKTIRKNSNTRKIIYNLMDMYYERLENLCIDDEFSLKNIDLKNIGNKISYSHLFIDEVNKLNEFELNMILDIIDIKDYSNIIVTFNPKDKKIENSLGKERTNIKKLLEKHKNVKTVLLKEKFNNKKQEDTLEESEEKNNLYMESYKYLDIRHNVEFEFAKDTSSLEEFILEPNGSGEIISNDELLKLPVYSDIAAGEPIMINDIYEGGFKMPKHWLKGAENSFILKVKGDSMINANIDDGDHVIIRKQYNANNNDIVAVDLGGSATLKRMRIKDNKVLLMPENSKYDPIEIIDNNAAIIGKAIGIIKNN
ncbi:MAG: LexA family protein [Clostridium sp.]